MRITTTFAAGLIAALAGLGLAMPWAAAADTVTVSTEFECTPSDSVPVECQGTWNGVVTGADGEPVATTDGSVSPGPEASIRVEVNSPVGPVFFDVEHERTGPVTDPVCRTTGQACATPE